MGFFVAIQQAGDAGLLFLRVTIGAIFWVHGRMKKGTWQLTPSDQVPAPMLTILRILSVAEPLGAVAIALGLFAQLTALCFCLVMVGAIPARIKQGAKFLDRNATGWELELLVFAACLALVLNGAGIYSLDQLFFGIG